MAVKERDLSLNIGVFRRRDTRIASRADYAVCHRVMRAASKNYSYASTFLPADKRPHVEALYALMRVGDDRVDVSHEGFSSPLEAINEWEYLYWHAFETGDSHHPVMRAYLDTARTFDIPAEIMRPYFQAMRDDLTVTRFDTFDDLLGYMDGSAVPVGRAMTYLLGTRRGASIEDALLGADALSIAMQLSNFWRDIGEDYHQIGRIYLPGDDMESFGVSEDDIAHKRITPGFVALLEYQITRTERYYQQAREAITLLASGQWAVMSGLEIYHAILPAIRRNGYDVFTQRARTSHARKLGLAARAFWLTR
jgi:phytoene/squalene synthetase